MRYLRPNDLDEAIAAVAAGGLPLAGGSVVVPLIARGALAPSAVVDVGRLAPLRELRDADGELHVGSAVTLSALERIEPAGEAALPEAAAGVGNPLVRRVATVGGNVASRLPTADLVPALLVLDAEVSWAEGGAPTSVEETLAAEDAHPGLQAAIRIRREPKRRSGFVKFAWREATGASVASVAFAGFARKDSLAEPRVAVGGLVAPCRLGRVEAALAGRVWSDLPIEEAAAEAAGESAERSGLPADDLRPRLVALGVRRLFHRLGTA